MRERHHSALFESFVKPCFQCHISLVKLDLRNNLLTMITPGLSRLNNLVELNLSGNRINHLSKVSGLSMPNLKLLHVFSCQVKTVDGA